MSVIDTERLSAGYRAKAINVRERKLLITRFTGSEQEKDLSEPANCRGLGRVRHFCRQSTRGWPSNPLPLDPACRALGLPREEMVRAQVFQNAACNWRCWYCFVDFKLLAANPKHSELVTADDLVEMYLDQPDPPRVIDLTGGQPDLTPEWIAWMMDALERRDLTDSVFLWSDDNLSNDYFWQFLDRPTRARIAAYSNHARVCCFKGYNKESFAFNTAASPDLFLEQFRLMVKLLDLGLDLYAYVTLTTPGVETIAADMHQFVNRLQLVDPNLPLRTVPLEVRPFTPVMGRLDPERVRSMELQWVALQYWQAEILHRFSEAERSVPIEEVPLRVMGKKR
jgi:uncharacterized Fe-S cluster-containing radical SAM superfamily protein